MPYCTRPKIRGDRERCDRWNRTAMSHRVALGEAAREVADHQSFAGALEPAHELADAYPASSRAVGSCDGEVLVGIDGEAARLHLVDAFASHQLAKLLGFALLIGHAGKAEEIDGGVDAALFRQADRGAHVFPAI